ncbi:hypothetical protein [Microvirga makkahensis]|uniref:hypothetical protein n=1 Tax=Microvirga makkahensis TaxID=1128670 RepID=UPI00197C2F88|nr:hypothetical protein [Microvirga makkahensis]
MIDLLHRKALSGVGVTALLDPWAQLQLATGPHRRVQATDPGRIGALNIAAHIVFGSGCSRRTVHPLG